MSVKTKSIFQPLEDEDGLRILITRFYPRGVSREKIHDWASVLSPTPELLFAFKGGRIGWEKFKQQFIDQLRSNLESVEAIHTLHDLSVNEDVTLLCYERSGNPCHRHLVREIIERPELLSPLSLPAACL